MLSAAVNQIKIPQLYPRSLQPSLLPPQIHIPTFSPPPNKKRRTNLLLPFEIHGEQLVNLSLRHKTIIRPPNIDLSHLSLGPAPSSSRLVSSVFLTTPSPPYDRGV
ncbi:unnamed protein product [Linum tenue]|uniref:Uncharacterized protein n=1 Tax=Linum tenue TaxID=586396 RepID=A0AAV0MS55_9ROSI|nr:unnamed protein product [Linum tenue]